MDWPDIDSLWNYADPAASESIFRSVLPAAQTSGNADYHAQLLTQIARSQILQRKFDQGHATLDAAEKIISSRTPIAHIRCLLERGRAWNDQGLAERAIAAFSETFSLAQAARSDGYAVDALHMLGVMPPDENAVDWNLRAIDFARASSDPRARRWLGTLCMNLGVVCQRLKRYPGARSAFESSLKEFQQANNPARIRMARLCLAKNLRLEGDFENALASDRKLLAEIQSAGEPGGYALEEIAECLLALNRQDEAIPFFARAYAALSTDPWFPPTEKGRLLRLKKLGSQ